MRQALVRNTGVTTVVYLLGSLAGLVVVPILLRMLGPTQFGLYVLAQTLLSYSSLVGGGLHRGFTRSIVAREVGGDVEGARAVVGTGVTAMSLFGVVVALLALVLYPALIMLFHVPAIFTEAFGWILGGVTVSYVLNSAVTPYYALLVARDRLDLGKLVQALSIVFGSAASAVAAIRGYGLPGVAVATAVVGALSCVLTVGLAMSVDRDATRARPAMNLGVLRELWEYGSRMQFVALSGLVNRSIDRVFIGMFRSPADVAVYDVGDRAAYSIVYTANTMAEALSPRMSAQIASNDLDAARSTYSQAFAFFSVFAMMFATFAAFQSRLLLHAWLGPSLDPRSVWALAVLALGYGATVSCSAANLLATSLPRPTLAMRFSIAQSAINVALSCAGAWAFGLLGAATASAITGGVGSIVFALLVERNVLGVDKLLGPRRLARASLLAVPIGAALAVLTAWIASAIGAGRVVSFALLAVALLLQALVTVAMASKLNLLPAGQVRTLVKEARSAVRRSLTFGRS